MKNFLRFCSLVFVVAFVSSLLSLSSCRQSTAPDLSDNIQSSTDNAVIDGEFTSVFSFATSQADVSTGTIIDKHGNEIQSPPDSKSDQLPPCAVVNFDTAAKTILIDFGSSNCMCNDGLARRGKIQISLTGVWKNVGSSINVTLIDYFVQDMHCTGSKTVSILAPNSFNVIVSNASIQTTSGTISWNANRTITQTKGMLTHNLTIDDEFTISGNASGVNREGTGFSVVIDPSHPLVKRVACFLKDFVSGIISIANDKGKTLAVNYDPDGTMECNKNAIVTVNGKSYTCKLR